MTCSSSPPGPRALPLAALAGLLLAATPASADTFWVTTTADISLLNVTLSDAILLANAEPGPDRIEFFLSDFEGGYDSSTGTWTITLIDDLPPITDTVTIDGYSQNGTAPVRVFIDAASEDEGLRFVAGSDGSSLLGVGVGGASETGVLVTGATNIALDGCWLGVAQDGVGALPNALDGLRVGSNASVLLGLGGPAPNVISGNGRHGVMFDGASLGASTIVNARIGVDPPGTSGLGNGGDGVHIAAGSGHVVGASTQPNTIAWNVGAGVALTGTTMDNQLLRNVTHDNGGLGLDIGDDGVTANDAGDVDAGPNGALNFPWIDWVGADGSDLVVAGWTRPGTTVALFSAAADVTGYGEGAWLAEADEGSVDDEDTSTSTYTSPAGSDTTTRFRFTFSGTGLLPGDAIVLAAADPSGSTSEHGAVTSLSDLQADVDSDGLSELEEHDLGTDPDSADTDGDGLDDGLEVNGGNPTDPLDADTDGDGLDDGVEDADADGVVDPGETDPNDPDSDGDGISDGDEIADGSDPTESDSDGDGVTDGDEVAAGTDPNSSDSDGDGLDDATEIAGPTDPTNPDTDGDGIDDGAETAGPTDPVVADTDGDGLLDGDEDVDGDGIVDPGESSPVDDDSDDDGLTDGNELVQGTDPRSFDTDGDGLGDGLELGLTAPQGDDTGSAFVPDADGATTTNPLLADTDGGGVSDGSEDANLDGAIDPGEGDPNDPSDDATLIDTDGDGLTDASEDNAGTSPTNPDSDGDGVDDGADGLGDSDGDGVIDALDPDSDNDGIDDGAEDLDGDGVVDPGETDPNDADTDDDGLGDGDELASGGDPLDPDTDDDGIDDGTEVAIGTDLTDDDSDDDGLLDGNEDLDQDGVLDAGETDPLSADSDSDGLTDGVELGLTAPQGGDTAPGGFGADADPTTTTDPLDADTDGGGVADGAEDLDLDGAIDPGEGDPNDPSDDGVQVDTDGDGLPDAAEVEAGTNPFSPDTDGDGVGDAVEVLGGATDPLDDDTDDDGLLDGSEDLDGDGLVGEGETDPALWDTDGDGLSDGVELGLEAPEAKQTDGSVFRRDRDPSTTTDPLSADTDGGGAPDGAEDADLDGAIDDGETDPNDPSDDDPYMVDTDGDGLSDGLEADHGTDRLDPDTDDDGLGDGLEVRLGTDPLVAERLQGSGASCSQGGGAAAWWAFLPLALLWVARRRRAQVAQALLLGLALAAVATPSSATAQERPRLDVQRFDPVAQSPGLVRVRDAELLPGRFSWTAGFSVNYGLRPFELGSSDGGARKAGVVDHVVGFDLVGAIGFADLFQVGLAMPVLQLTPGSESSQLLAEELGGSGGVAGIGDLTVELGIQAFRQSRHGVSVAFVPRVVIPTGSRAIFVGSGAFAAGADGAITRRWKHLRVAGNLGFQVHFGGADVMGLQADDELHWGVAVGVPLADDRIEIVGEWTGATVIDPQAHEALGTRPFDPTITPSELTAHVLLDPPGPLAFTFGGGRGIGPGWGTPDLRLFSTVQLRPDAVRAPAPAEAEDPDRDGDGILNEVDACPDAAETFNEVYDEDGCPEVDADADGVGDATDACPNVPEDRDGFEDGDGCPEADNDQDGVADEVDDCPLLAEDMDGIADDDGCPEEGLAQMEMKDGVPTRIVIFERVYFAVNEATIEPISHGVLGDVAALLEAYPEVTKLEVGGHTDSQGDDEYNRELSERRAGAVVRFLVERGVSADRLVGRGFGESAPIDSNDTEAGRQRNRRVEFLVVEQGPSRAAEE